jgi:hypothetical protein
VRAPRAGIVAQGAEIFSATLEVEEPTPARKATWSLVKTLFRDGIR